MSKINPTKYQAQLSRALELLDEHHVSLEKYQSRVNENTLPSVLLKIKILSRQIEALESKYNLSQRKEL